MRITMAKRQPCLILIALCIVFLTIVIAMSTKRGWNNRTSPTTIETDDINPLKTPHQRRSQSVSRSSKPAISRGITEGCKLADRGNVRKYYSQSREDIALYTKYFSKPNICNGVYLEIGALDGVTYSNTKFFEDYLGWTGVLIEANPSNAMRLGKNRPNSAVFKEAVCKEGQTHVDFAGQQAVGGVLSEMTDKHKHRFLRNNDTISVPCQPIGAMIHKAGFTAVDFFVLDVEGAELMVLETMDWNIPVGVFVVEMGRGVERDQQLIDMLAKHGYNKATWNIRDFCKGECANNMVFENSKYFKTN